SLSAKSQRATSDVFKSKTSSRKSKILENILVSLDGYWLVEFQWVKKQARKLGIPLPPQLTAFGLTALEKKRKRSFELIKEVFVKKDIVVDAMHRNLVPSLGVVPSEGLVIIKVDSKIADETYRKMINVLEARDDLVEARKIYSTSEGQMTIEEAKAQMEEIKRLEFLKAEKEKFEKRLKADPLPITKISYRVNNSTKEASMRIIRDNQPLNLIVYDKFVLKTLGFSKWLEVHALACKVKSKLNDLLLKNLKVEFQWVKKQARKLGIPLPPQLTAFGLTALEKKRKRSFELIKEVFVKKDIVVDAMHRNLVPSLGVVPSEGLVISEPESGIFFYNDNFYLVF
nr:hypothetical protein [Tanacetum cinerariifolium]